MLSEDAVNRHTSGNATHSTFQPRPSRSWLCTDESRRRLAWERTMRPRVTRCSERSGSGERPISAHRTVYGKRTLQQEVDMVPDPTNDPSRPGRRRCRARGCGKKTDVTTVVVALGGNALTKPGESGSAAEQASNAARMAAAVGKLVTAGHRIVVTHGNGPQVGNLAIQQFAAKDVVPALPLHLMGAMTQGYMGSIIIRALWDQLPGHRDKLAAIVTHAIDHQGR